MRSKWIIAILVAYGHQHLVILRVNFLLRLFVVFHRFDVGRQNAQAAQIFGDFHDRFTFLVVHTFHIELADHLE